MEVSWCARERLQVERDRFRGQQEAETRQIAVSLEDARGQERAVSASTHEGTGRAQECQCQTWTERVRVSPRHGQNGLKNDEQRKCQTRGLGRNLLHVTEPDARLPYNEAAMGARVREIGRRDRQIRGQSEVESDREWRSLGG
eukprot:894002-Rhodomonas_salina.2